MFTNTRYNVKTVYAVLLGFTMHSLHKTQKEAETKAEAMKPFYVNGYPHQAYVLALAPGQLNDDLYQGSQGANDYIKCGDDDINTFQRPLWLKMSTKLERAIARNKASV